MRPHRSHEWQRLGMTGRPLEFVPRCDHASITAGTLAGQDLCSLLLEYISGCGAFRLSPSGAVFSMHYDPLNQAWGHDKHWTHWIRLLGPESGAQFLTTGRLPPGSHLR